MLLSRRSVAPVSMCYYHVRGGDVETNGETVLIELPRWIYTGCHSLLLCLFPYLPATLISTHHLPVLLLVPPSTRGFWTTRSHFLYAVPASGALGGALLELVCDILYSAWLTICFPANIYPSGRYVGMEVNIFYGT